MRFSSLLLLAILAFPAMLAAQGYTADYTGTFAGSSVIPATHSYANFTVLLCANMTLGNGNACQTIPSLKGTGSGGSVTSSSGYDITFSSTPCAAATLLNWEMPSYTASTGAMEAWVLVPSLAASGTIHMCMGNSSITTFQGGATGSAWSSNYVGRYHFPNGTTLSVADSSSSGNNGTNNGATATSGQVDGGAAMVSASSQYISTGTTNLPTGSAARSVFAWVYLTSVPSIADVIYSAGAASKDNAAILYVSNGGSAYLCFSGYSDDFCSGLTVSLNTWHYVGYTYSAGSNFDGVTVYMDNTSQTGSAAGHNVLNTSSGVSYIGKHVGSGAHYWDGVIDDVALLNAALPKDWVTLQFTNQSSPGTFVTWSAIAPPAVGAAPAGLNIAGNFTGTAIDLWPTFQRTTGDTFYSVQSAATFANGASAGTTTLNRGDGNGNVTLPGIVFSSINDYTFYPGTSGQVGLFSINTLDMTNTANWNVSLVNNMLGYGPSPVHGNVPAGWYGKQSGAVAGSSNEYTSYNWKSTPPFTLGGWVCLPVIRQYQGGSTAGDMTLTCSPDGGTNWVNPYNYYHQGVTSVTSCSGGTVVLATNAATGDVPAYAASQEIWIHGFSSSNTALNGEWTTAAGSSNSVTFSIGSSCSAVTTGAVSDTAYASLMSSTGDAPTCAAASTSATNCGNGTSTGVAYYASPHASVMWPAQSPYDGSTGLMQRLYFITTRQPSTATEVWPWGNYVYGYGYNGNSTNPYLFQVPNTIDAVLDPTQYQWYSNPNYTPTTAGNGTWTSTQANAAQLWNTPNNTWNSPLAPNGNLYSTPFWGCSGSTCLLIFNSQSATAGQNAIIGVPAPWGPFTSSSYLTPLIHASVNFLSFQPWTFAPVSDGSPFHLVGTAAWADYIWNSGQSISAAVSLNSTTTQLTLPPWTTGVVTMPGAWTGTAYFSGSGVSTSGSSACWATALNGSYNGAYVDATHMNVAVNTSSCTPGAMAGSPTIQTNNSNGYGPNGGEEVMQTVDLHYIPQQTGTALTGNQPDRLSMGAMANAVPRRGLQYWFDFWEHKGSVRYFTNTVTAGSPTSITLYGYYAKGGGTLPLVISGTSGGTASCWAAINGTWTATWLSYSSGNTVFTIPANTTGCGSGRSGPSSVTSPGYAGTPNLYTYDQARAIAQATANVGVANVSCSSGTITLTTATNAFATGGGTPILVYGLTNSAANGFWTTSSATSTTVVYSNGSGACTGITNGADMTGAVQASNYAYNSLPAAAMGACYGSGCGYTTGSPTSIGWTNAGMFNSAATGPGSSNGFRLMDLGGNFQTTSMFSGDVGWTINLVLNVGSISTIQNIVWIGLAASNVASSGSTSTLSITEDASAHLGVYFQCTTGGNQQTIPGTFTGWSANSTNSFFPDTTSFNMLTITKNPGTPATGSTGNLHVFLNGVEVSMAAVSSSGSGYTMNNCVSANTLMNLAYDLHTNITGNNGYLTVSNFSAWNRALSLSEIGRLHAVLKAQMAVRGVTLQ